MWARPQCSPNWHESILRARCGSRSMMSRAASLETIGNLNGTVSGQARDVVPGIAGLEQDLLGVLAELGRTRARCRNRVREAHGGAHNLCDGPGVIGVLN